MRLWSLHPRYLDVKGLSAVWREGLLAQKVLRGLTKGYRHHPQLERFRSQKDPVAAIGAYLSEVFREAGRRGYCFDRSRIFEFAPKMKKRIPVTQGQMRFEKEHLFAKLRGRSPEFLKCLGVLRNVDPHPLFKVHPGPIEPWEKMPQKETSDRP